MFVEARHGGSLPDIIMHVIDKYKLIIECPLKLPVDLFIQERVHVNDGQYHLGGVREMHVLEFKGF